MITKYALIQIDRIIELLDENGRKFIEKLYSSMQGFDDMRKVTILECGGKDVFTNCPPKSALKYCGHLDFKKNLRDMLLVIVEQAHPTEKGGVE